MKFYIAENQKPVGPYEVKELIEKGIKGSDLVWAEGMSDWAQAESMPEIREAMYSNIRQAEEYRETAIPDLPQQPQCNDEVPPAPPHMRQQCGQPQDAYRQPYAGQEQPVEIPPKTWLVESILVTLFCCLPFGIVGIIKAASVSSLWQTGRHEESRRASAEAKKWTIIGFIAGLAAIVIYFAIIAIIGVSSIEDNF